VCKADVSYLKQFVNRTVFTMLTSTNVHGYGIELSNENVLWDQVGLKLCIVLNRLELSS